MRALILLISILFNPLNGFNQKTEKFIQNNQSYEVTILENDPYPHYNAISGGIGIINVSANNGFTFPLFANASIIDKKYSFTANSKLHLRFNQENPFDIASVYEVKLPRDISANFTYNFLNIERQGKIFMPINCGRNVCWGIKVPALVNYRVGLDLGAQIGSVWRDLKFIEFTGVGYDGTIYKIGHSISDGANFMHTYRSTFYDYAFIKTGISINSIKRLKINYEGQKREVNRSLRWYVNALYAPYILIDDVFVQVLPSSAVEEVYDEDLFRRLELQSTMDLSRFGWALGVQGVSLTKLGMEYKFEVGAIPGPKSKLEDSFYINSTISVGFGWFKEKNKPENKPVQTENENAK
jgi:hypothetical protein